MKIDSDLPYKSPIGIVLRTYLTEIPNKTQDVEIFTGKCSNGELFSIAQFGKVTQKENYKTFSYVMYQDEKVSITRQKKRATLKNISEQHKEAVHKFITEHLKMTLEG